MIYKFPSVIPERNGIEQDALTMKRVEYGQIGFSLVEESDEKFLLGQATLTRQQAGELAYRLLHLLSDDDNETTEELSYDLGYTQGHKDGASETQEAMYDFAYDEGYHDGYYNGHSEGYDEGFDEGLGEPLYEHEEDEDE